MKPLLKKLPKRLKIGAHQIAVETFHGRIPDEAIGYNDCKHNGIVVDSNQEPSAFLATLLHEINHQVDNELDHNMVEMIAQAYTQILIDNPAFIKFLHENYT